MRIELIAGKWLVNGKSFNELTPNEKILLDQFFEEMKSSLKL
jgi:hypothetical protein